MNLEHAVSKLEAQHGGGANFSARLDDGEFVAAEFVSSSHHRRKKSHGDEEHSDQTSLSELEENGRKMETQPCCRQAVKGQED